MVSPNYAGAAGRREIVRPPNDNQTSTRRATPRPAPAAKQQPAPQWNARPPQQTPPVNTGTAQQPRYTAPASPSNDGHTRPGTTDRQPTLTWPEIWGSMRRKFTNSYRSHKRPLIQRRTQPTSHDREEHVVTHDETAKPPKAKLSLLARLVIMVVAIMSFYTLLAGYANQENHEYLYNQTSQHSGILTNTHHDPANPMGLFGDMIGVLFALVIDNIVITLVIVLIVAFWLFVRKLKKAKAESSPHQ